LLFVSLLLMDHCCQLTEDAHAAHVLMTIQAASGTDPHYARIAAGDHFCVIGSVLEYMHRNNKSIEDLKVEHLIKDSEQDGLPNMDSHSFCIL